MYMPTDTSPVSLLWRIPTFVVTKAIEFPFDVVRSIMNGVRHPVPAADQGSGSQSGMMDVVCLLFNMACVLFTHVLWPLNRFAC